MVLLALIFAWCALIWGITMVKLAHAEESSIDDIFSEIEAEELAADDATLDEAAVDAVSSDRSFIDDHGKWVKQREEHQKFIEAQPAIWWENWQDKVDPEK